MISIATRLAGRHVSLTDGPIAPGWQMMFISKEGWEL